MSSPSDDSQPRRETVEPVSLTAKKSPKPASGGPPDREAKLRRLTIAGFSILALLAVGVFVLLPPAVERHDDVAEVEPGEADAEGAAEESLESLLAPPADAEDPAALAARAAAEESLTDFVSLKNRLLEQDVESWAELPFAEARARAREAEHLLRDRRFSEAAERMAEAVAGLRKLELRAQTLYDEALRGGAIALDSGDAADAREQFEMAARIHPGDAAAREGLERANTIERVFALLREGGELEAQGDLAGALQRYEAGVALDPDVTLLKIGRSRVVDELTLEAFESSMTRGFAALRRGDYPRSTVAFQDALRIRPNAPSALDGLAQSREAASNRDVRGYRETAQRFESEERWHDALAEYQAALVLDPDVGFAQSGASRSRARARLADSLDAYLNSPARLSTAAVRGEARQVLAQADAVQTPGPVLREQIDAVAKLLQEMSTPVPVDLISDAQTDVLLYHVGRLGRFEVRRLELTPGRYTVVGTRAGYRDSRVQFTVSAGTPPAPVMVRCEDEI